MHARRYAFLDGIRGLAAIITVTRHTDGFWNFSLFRSYLAVDLFFILSGFVVAYAYDEKMALGKMAFKDFVLVRLIRLYPQFCLSVLLCALILIFEVAAHRLSGALAIDNALLVIVCSLLFIPCGSGNSSLFPINGPYWSLFYELIANFAYAWLRPLLTARVLLLILVFFIVAMLGAAWGHGSLDVGSRWGFKSMLAGFSRAMFGVFFGLLLYRQRGRLAGISKHPLMPWLAVLAIVLVLVSPSAGLFDPLLDLLMVTLVFPVCIACAAQAEPSRADSVLLFLGVTSYPIYVLHQPAGEIFGYLLSGGPAPYAPYIGLLLVALLVALSWWLEKIYDIPVRRWATRKLRPAR